MTQSYWLLWEHKRDIWQPRSCGPFEDNPCLPWRRFHRSQGSQEPCLVTKGLWLSPLTIRTDLTSRLARHTFRVLFQAWFIISNTCELRIFQTFPWEFHYTQLVHQFTSLSSSCTVSALGGTKPSLQGLASRSQLNTHFTTAFTFHKSQDHLCNWDKFSATSKKWLLMVSFKFQLSTA